MKIMKMYNLTKYNTTKSRPKFITWDITNQCNLHCMHCFNNSGDVSCHEFQYELNRDEQMNLAKQIALMQPEQCCLCGGESLLNENIFDIIKIIADNGVIVNLVSNGMLLDSTVAKKLAKSGINQVQISVDGLGYQHDLFRCKSGSFQKAIEALKNLLNENITPVASFCPNKLNVSSIDMYACYMYERIGIKTIRMMPLLPMGRAKERYKDIELTSYELFQFVYKIHKIEAKYKGLKMDWGDPLEHLFLVLLNKRKYPVSLGISSTGKLTVSPYLPITVGDVRKHTLVEYWKNGYNKIWDNYDIRKMISKILCIYDLNQKIVSKDFDIMGG